MLRIQRLTSEDSNVRDALVLGAFLAFILLVAVFVTVRIYTQLDRIASLQRTLVSSQQQLYDVLRSQLDEEVGLRGNLGSSDPQDLNPSGAGVDDFATALGDLQKSARTLSIPGLGQTLDEMGNVHREWETQVAGPIMRGHLTLEQQRYIETRGKQLADRERYDADDVSRMLQQRLGQAQLELRRGIDETLRLAVSAILLFGAAGLVVVLWGRRMLKRIDRERRIIEVLQRAFRTGWDSLPRSRIGTAYVSATRDASVGGDLFDVRRLDEHRGLLIVADVSGKGIEAAVNTAFVKYSIRTLALTHDDPGEILAAFNRMFLDAIKDPGLFVVAFVAIFDARTLRLSYASAGHSGAFVRRGSEVRRLDVTGPIVGLDKNFSYESRTLDLQPRDLVVLATDGLTEARDRSGRTLDEEGAMLLVRDSPADPQACADELVSQVRRRSGGRINDDLALLVLEVEDVWREPAKREKNKDEAA